ncbi:MULTISPECIES: NmrA family NAD(P)-binding protein [Myxococcus]|uniref:NmrA family transcriptional regulator n=1 Tax=Myxococcus llanfairpwllgwyngyllgogerychwyrndrobwllllantysiliogogogochensis TaxID=2590453 RepID=A0A540X717_9BACT|nr:MULTISPECIES: NmrA family NAD(P)-binding protein [Myxococcus]NTX01750.1 NAD(P)H-binding protein [Myxococcus sp. CA040A]TQF17096.1 NmrA family transcriptional regulator [Myxococcus llanfairpwllgwyngyllgogerychwyrndrobwllllantysiliogogogochensis]
MSIVINTPNGNIGRNLALRLLEAGQSLTLISRSAEKVADLVKRGAKVVEGSSDDAAVLDKAFAGASAVFWLTPPAMRPDFVEWTQAMGRLAAQKAKQHGVKRVVVLSSVGAQSGPGTGPVGVLREVEEAFKAAVADVTILRPGYFMENLLRDLPSLVNASTLFLTIPPERRAPFVATVDIAHKAADVLLDAGWKGHRYIGVHGPQDLTYTEVVGILSRELGQPVRYVQVSFDDARKAMLGMGLPGFMVDLFVQMYEAIPEGRMDAAEPRSAETTTSTTLAQWAREVLKPAVAQARASAA